MHWKEPAHAPVCSAHYTSVRFRFFLASGIARTHVIVQTLSSIAPHSHLARQCEDARPSAICTGRRTTALLILAVDKTLRSFARLAFQASHASLSKPGQDSESHPGVTRDLAVHRKKIWSLTDHHALPPRPPQHLACCVRLEKKAVIRQFS